MEVPDENQSPQRRRCHRLAHEYVPETVEKSSAMKRVLISLGLGLLIIPTLLGLLLVVKIVSPADYPPAFMWLFIWPLPLLRALCRITYVEVTAGRVMLLGLFGDYLFLSLLAYLSLAIRGRFLKRKGRVSPPPLPPAPFSD